MTTYCVTVDRVQVISGSRDYGTRPKVTEYSGPITVEALWSQIAEYQSPTSWAYVLHDTESYWSLESLPKLVERLHARGVREILELPMIAEVVVSDGDETTVQVARLTRDQHVYWVTRLLGPRTPHATAPVAIAELEQVAMAYAGLLRMHHPEWL